MIPRRSTEVATILAVPGARSASVAPFHSRILMAFAVIRAGGQQYRVRPGDIIDVELMEGASGPVAFDQVLLVDDDDGRQVGTPTVREKTVRGTVLSETKGRKLRIFTYHAKKRHRRRMGHRQRYTRVRIEGIERASSTAEAAAKPARKTRAKSSTTASAKPKATAKPKAAAKPNAKAKAAAKPKAKSKSTKSASE